MLALYFQYTHLSNTELSELRTYLSTVEGKVQLLSASELVKMPKVTFFGKLLVMLVPFNSFSDSLLTNLYSKHGSIKLLFIYYANIMFTASLFSQYREQLKVQSNKPNQWLFSTSRLFLYTILYKIRYRTLSVSTNVLEKISKLPNYVYIC